MTEATALELRHVRLVEPVTLRPAPLGDGEEGVFVAIDDSPPVRTVVAVVEGGRRRALEVAWVVEVAEQGDGTAPVRGFYGRWVADEALERAAKVGTEHLEDGTPVVQPVIHDNSVLLDVSDTSMAMPAPVMMRDDDTGVVDIDDDDDDRDASASDSSVLPIADAEPLDHATLGDDEPLPGDTVTYADYRRSGGEAHAYSEARADAHSDDDERDAGVPEAVDAEQTAPETTYPGEDDAAEADDAAEPDAAESSTDAGEVPGEPGESSEPGDGDASESRSKGGRKKRGRKRR